MNDKMIKRIGAALIPALTGTYDCIRVWEAWSVGTMGEDDFEEVSENPERLNEIAQAVISALTPADIVALGARCWQPIETAPKDGSKIILARIGENEVGKNLGVWWACSGSWSEKYSRWWDGIEPCGFNHPTHWMPLPAAPSPTGKKEVSMTDFNLDAAVNRFLGWKLPDDFNPDGGITRNSKFNSLKPTGTNLMDATQAREMLAYVLDVQETDKETIHLGGQTFKVSTFSFEQLQRMMPAFGRLELGMAEGGLDAALEIISAALPDVDLSTLCTTVPEILAAVPVVARVSGLVQLGMALAGKAEL